MVGGTWSYTLQQGSSNLSLEVQSAAEFSSNSDQTRLPRSFRLIWKRHGLCVGARLEQNSAGLWPSRNWVWHHWSTGSRVHPSERETGKQTDQNIYFTLIFSKLCLKKLACLLLQCSNDIWKRCVWTTKRTPLLLFFQMTNIQSTARLVFCVKDRVTGVESASKRAQRMHDLDRISKDLWKRTFRLNRKQSITQKIDWPQMSLVFWGHVIFGNIIDYYWLHGYYWTRTELSWMMT